MKKITPLKSLALLITLFCAVTFGFGQIVAWDMDTNTGNEATVNATTLAANLNMSIISRGSGIDPSALDDAFSSNDFFDGSTTLADAVSNSEYLQFQISAVAGYIVSLSTLDANFRRSSTGPNAFIWRYSTDGINFIDIGTAISYTGTQNNGSAQTQIDLSAIPALQNVVSATTITFRVYGWGATGSTGSFAIGRLGGDDLRLGGAISPSGACSTSTTYSTLLGWDNGVPTIGINAIIADNYNTSDGGDEVSFSACNLTINNGATLTIADNDYVEVDNDLEVIGNITVRPYGAFVQNNDLGAVTYNGVITVEKENAPADVWYEYTYWSSPVENETIEFGLAETEASRIFMFDAENYYDSDGNDIDDDGNDWQWVSAATVMEQGVGYASTQNSIIFGFPSDQITYTFEGPFNNGEIKVPVYRNDTAPTIDNNWNLIGNPYPSAIDAQLFLDANTLIEQDITGTDYSGNAYTDGAIFLWSQKSDYSAANEGNQALNFSSSDYAIINGTGQTAGGDGLQPNRYIPSGQSFFISMSDSATPISTDGNNVSMGEVIFNNSMRVFGNISGVDTNSQFFKTSNSKKNTAAMANKLGVNLTSDNGVFNQTLIGYVNGASNDDDGSYFDARKNLSTGTSAILYSTIEGSDKKFAIQGKDINSINEDEIINLGFSTTIDVATIYTLSIAQIEGDFLSNNPVYLKDNLLNELHDLSASDYTFTSEVGEFNERFEIVFSSTALSTDEVTLNSKSLRIIELEDDRVQFTASDNLRIKSVNIFDLLGRQLYSFKGDNASETYRLYNLHSSIYIAKVALSNGVVVTKKAIKK